VAAAAAKWNEVAEVVARESKHQIQSTRMPLSAAQLLEKVASRLTRQVPKAVWGRASAAAKLARAAAQEGLPRGGAERSRQHTGIRTRPAEADMAVAVRGKEQEVVVAAAEGVALAVQAAAAAAVVEKVATSGAVERFAVHIPVLGRSSDRPVARPPHCRLHTAEGWLGEGPGVVVVCQHAIALAAAEVSPTAGTCTVHCRDSLMRRLERMAAGRRDRGNASHGAVRAEPGAGRSGARLGQPRARAAAPGSAARRRRFGSRPAEA